MACGAGAMVSTPVSLVEWFLSFYDQAAAGPVRPLECVCREGTAWPLLRFSPAVRLSCRAQRAGRGASLHGLPQGRTAVEVPGCLCAIEARGKAPELASNMREGE